MSLGNCAVTIRELLQNWALVFLVLHAKQQVTLHLPGHKQTTTEKRSQRVAV